MLFFFFFQAEDGIRDLTVTGVQTCALPILLLEYQLPLTSKRIDCMLTGENPESRDNAVIVELKQWEDAEPSAAEDCVTVWVGQGMRDVLHPSRQVGNYQEYLEDCHTAFSSEGHTA